MLKRLARGLPPKASVQWSDDHAMDVRGIHPVPRRRLSSKSSLALEELAAHPQQAVGLGAGAAAAGLDDEDWDAGCASEHEDDLTGAAA